MNSFNEQTTYLFDFAFRPIESLSLLWQLIIASAIFGIFFLVAYGFVSNQEEVKRIKKQFQACLYEIALYRNQTLVSVKSQIRMMELSFHYLLISLFPFLILATPGILLLSQFHLRFAYASLEVGREVIVQVKMEESQAVYGVKLELPEDLLEIESSVRIPDQKEIDWKIKSKKPGIYSLTFHYENSSESKRLVVGEAKAKINSKRVKDAWKCLLYPGEPCLESNHGIREISILYPEARYSFLSLHWHWLVLLLVVSFFAAFCCHRFFEVEI